MYLIKQAVRKVFPEQLYQKMAYYKMLWKMRAFKKQYPQTKLFDDILNKEKKAHHYSQYNQDFIVYSNFFSDQKAGFFCDVGSNHPLKINNTRYFEEQGLDGYAFEPLPHMKALWKQHRKAKFFPYAASDTEGEVTFSIVNSVTGWEDMLSYVKETATTEYDYITEEITVKTRLLSDVFEEESITNIDYMSIDVEGHELQVIKGIDFNKVRINVLTIENNFGGAGEDSYYGDDRIREIMFNNGYELWGRIIGLDDIYVRSDFINQLD